ncbi:hypothetical protein SNEBB_006755 [Seison nebaliae]|nr:hypothetical protein SNEBB_006755 [Seison nebaliae]
MSQLHSAILLGHSNQLRRILKDRSVPVNKVDENGRSPLHLCCYINQNIFSVSTVKLLLKYGANINEEEKDGRTLLINCCIFQRFSLLNYILQVKEVDVTATDIFGYNALHYASYLSAPSILEQVLDAFNQRQISVTSTIPKGDNILHISIKMLSFTNALLIAGKCPELRKTKDKKLRTSLEILESQEDILKSLMKRYERKEDLFSIERRLPKCLITSPITSTPTTDILSSSLFAKMSDLDIFNFKSQLNSYYRLISFLHTPMKKKYLKELKLPSIHPNDNIKNNNNNSSNNEPNVVRRNKTANDARPLDMVKKEKLLQLKEFNYNDGVNGEKRPTTVSTRNYGRSWNDSMGLEDPSTCAETYQSETKETVTHQTDSDDTSHSDLSKMKRSLIAANKKLGVGNPISPRQRMGLEVVKNRNISSIQQLLTLYVPEGYIRKEFPSVSSQKEGNFYFTSSIMYTPTTTMNNIMGGNSSSMDILNNTKPQPSRRLEKTSRKIVSTLKLANA